jgi:hypothetical protein
MKAARWRFVLTLILFLAWLGWLAYLAATTTHPTVLSRPQFMISTLDVIARLEGDNNRPENTVTIVEVHWPPGEKDALRDKSITVTNFARCEGWEGPGEYILPLVRDGSAYQVARTPASPGYLRPHDFRIYRRTPQTMKQLELIVKPENLPAKP